MSGTPGKLEISLTAALWGLEGKTAPFSAPSLLDAQDHVPGQLQNGRGRSGVLSFYGRICPRLTPADDSCIRNPWALNGSTLIHLHTHFYSLTHSLLHKYPHPHSYSPEACWNEVTLGCCWHPNKSEDCIDESSSPGGCAKCKPLVGCTDSGWGGSLSSPSLPWGDGLGHRRDGAW